MTLAQRMLSAIAHPQIAYLLLTLGTLGLTIELWSPGAVVPGVVGGICLLLAFFALQVLPVSYAGLLLILLGLRAAGPRGEGHQPRPAGRRRHRQPAVRLADADRLAAAGAADRAAPDPADGRSTLSGIILFLVAPRAEGADISRPSPAKAVCCTHPARR